MSEASQLLRDAITDRYPQAKIGCSDGNCIYGSPGSQHTNGGCNCIDRHNPNSARWAAQRLNVAALLLAKRLIESVESGNALASLLREQATVFDAIAPHLSPEGFQILNEYPRPFLLADEDDQ